MSEPSEPEGEARRPPGRDPVAGDEAGITVMVNGEERVLPGDQTVADLVAAEVDSIRGVAVALNASLVPRSTWASTAVADGDRIELLRAAQGG